MGLIGVGLDSRKFVQKISGSVMALWNGVEVLMTELERDIFEERAAIREYEGGQDRVAAEREARREARAYVESVRVTGGAL